MVKNINNKEHPLYRYQEKLKSKKIKFIFFTNREFPIIKNNDEEVNHLEDNKDITFKKVDSEHIPLTP